MLDLQSSTPAQILGWAISVPPNTASRCVSPMFYLAERAARYDTHGDWEPLSDRARIPAVAKMLRRHGISMAIVSNDPKYRSTPLAVCPAPGRVRAWFAIVGGALLAHNGQMLFFRTYEHAQDAACLADYTHHLQQAAQLIPEVIVEVAKLPHLNLTDRFQAAMNLGEVAGTSFYALTGHILSLTGARSRIEGLRQSVTTDIDCPEEFKPFAGCIHRILHTLPSDTVDVITEMHEREAQRLNTSLNNLLDAPI